MKGKKDKDTKAGDYDIKEPLEAIINARKMYAGEKKLLKIKWLGERTVAEEKKAEA